MKHYSHDDDWGDYELERRRAKELDRKHDELISAVPPVLRSQVESSLLNAKLISQTFDAIFRDTSDTCPHCGKKHRGGFGCTCGDRP